MSMHMIQGVQVHGKSKRKKIHRDYDDRVFSEVGDDDVVIFGPKYKKLPYVWDASAVDRRYTE